MVYEWNVFMARGLKLWQNQGLSLVTILASKTTVVGEKCNKKS